jgi:methionyl aminopeptidase
VIILKSQAELKKMAGACHIVGEILEGLRAYITDGISTANIDEFVDHGLQKRGAVAAFKGYRGYPASVCVSINDQVIHGIPSKSVRIKNGDIVSVDLGAVLDGFFGDAAITVAVGEIGEQARRLLEVTEQSLQMGIAKAVIGNRIGDISSAIQQHVESHGFSVVRAFVGHGVGRSLHEEPAVPNFGRPGQGPRLKDGMTLAIEPMVNAGGSDVRVLDDDWTAVTADGSLSAHFEHTVAITKRGPKILTK